VADTGPGISATDQERIFEPFVQGENARTKKGTGLGLSITRRFVQALGGTIQLDSMPGRGSRFHIEAPVTAEAFEPTGEPATLTQVVRLETGQPEYRVLIVEDQTENWLLLQRLLSTSGFRVRVAENGAEAIELYREWRPHFIWMDLRLPGMSGLDAAKRIREQEGGKEVKIAAVTASAFTAQRDEVFRAGLDDFVRKPYRYTEVFDCLARHLGVRYETDGNRLCGAADPSVLHRNDLEALRPGLLEELRTAVLSLDGGRIAGVVRRISDENSSLGAALSVLADRLAYTPILHALRNCGNGAEESASRSHC
jgi:CheY-like chemotaxis protein